MTDQLLPPDPSKDGRYWIQLNHMKFIWMWSPRHRDWWHHMAGEISTQKAYEVGYRLASPHPNLTPEQLNALWCVMKWLGQPAFCPSAAERYRQAGREHVHEMLRAALGAKPDDPPGNGLDDIRAAAMDQWGVPRAGEETTP